MRPLFIAWLLAAIALALNSLPVQAGRHYYRGPVYRGLGVPAPVVATTPPPVLSPGVLVYLDTLAPAQKQAWLELTFGVATGRVLYLRYYRR